MNVAEQVVLCIQKAKGTQRQILPSDRLREDLGLDSFDSLMVVCDLEDVFNISVQSEELGSLVTVQDIIDSLEKRLGTAQTL